MGMSALTVWPAPATPVKPLTPAHELGVVRSPVDTRSYFRVNPP